MCGIWCIFGNDADCPVSKLLDSANSIQHRGPDCFRFENVNHYANCCFGFHRLAIIDDINGMQPMRLLGKPHIWVTYNGEIYNYKRLGKQFKFDYQTDCDGESLIHLYDRGGIDFMASQLDGVFNFCLLDTKAKKVFIGRDTYGVRPGFKYFNQDKGLLAVCSEVKGLVGVKQHDNGISKEKIVPVLPGHVEEYNLKSDGKVEFVRQERFHWAERFPRYKTSLRLDDVAAEGGAGDRASESTEELVAGSVEAKLRRLLTEAVKKRMIGQRRIGCMLSGGLDSSLITSLVHRSMGEMGLDYPLQTFCIGMEGSPDLANARIVADFLGTEHHEIKFTPEEGVGALSDVIRHLETYDITTIRASVGMYLVSQYIKRNTDSIIIFSGEGADELMQGYIYFQKAPSAEAAHEESVRLLEDLYLYDNLRADRTTAAFGLELRVPFLDHQFSSYFLSLDPELARPADAHGNEKFLIRSAFDPKDSSMKPFLPAEVLWRPKEAFSDGVSSQKKSWFQILQDFIEQHVTDQELEEALKTYPFNTPKTKESLFYRRKFEEFFPNCSHLTPYMWMPKWVQTDDPSARTLKNYQAE